MQDVLSLVAEENLRSLNSHLIVLCRVYHSGDFLGESLLQWSQAWVAFLLFLKGFNLVLWQIGEDLDIFGSVGVAHVKPELVELVGRSTLWVEPHIATLGLAKLTTIGLGNEWAGDGIGFATVDATDELGACSDVAPLVATAHLQAASLVLIEVEEVIALEQLVAELGERHTVVGIGGKALLDAVLCHHVVDGDVLANVANEVQE